MECIYLILLRRVINMMAALELLGGVFAFVTFACVILLWAWIVMSN